MNAASFCASALSVSSTGNHFLGLIARCSPLRRPTASIYGCFCAARSPRRGKRMRLFGDALRRPSPVPAALTMPGPVVLLHIGTAIEHTSSWHLHPTTPKQEHTRPEIMKNCLRAILLLQDLCHRASSHPASKVASACQLAREERPLPSPPARPRACMQIAAAWCKPPLAAHCPRARLLTAATEQAVPSGSSPGGPPTSARSPLGLRPPPVERPLQRRRPRRTPWRASAAPVATDGSGSGSNKGA
mmetsp:Transcript_18193/g.50640  ORF Transcript_18193/g.50640 Transcript_18193/m.50640 type:complete len:245 (+) Transcript_18193:14-748(+)